MQVLYLQPRTQQRLGVVLSVLLLLTLIALAYASALRVPMQHIDGAYQTLASLRHLSQGELPGRDYFPYLGVGISILLWPIYALAGSTVFASQFASHLCSLLACLAGSSLLSALALHAIGIRKAQLLALACGYAALTFALQSPGELHNVAVPGGSLYSLRSALVFAVAGAYFLVARKPDWQVWLSGCACAVFLLWSNDYAFTSTLVLHALLVLRFVPETGWRRALASGAGSLAIAVSGFLLLASLATGAHAYDLLRYNFAAVARDQYWYFFPYHATSRYFELSDLLLFWRHVPHELTTRLLLTIGFSALLFAPAVRRNVAAMSVGAAALTALAAALLSEVGGHKDNGYFSMSVHLLPLLPVVTLLPLTTPSQQARDFLARTLPAVKGVLEVVAVAVVALSCLGTLLNACQAAQRVRSDPSLRYVPQLDGYVGQAMAAELQAAQTRFGTGPTLALSTYLNPYDVLLGHRQAAPVDSIIHALGWLRSDFVAALRDPKVKRVVTTNPASPYLIDRQWENWGQHQNWSFQSELLRGFVPAFVGTRLIVWQRLRNPEPLRRAQACLIAPRAQTAPTNVTHIGVQHPRSNTLYDLRLRYALECDSSFAGARAILLVESGSRLGHLANTYSLPPHAGTASIPLGLPGSGQQVQLRAVPETRCRLTVTHCSATPIAVAPARY